MIVFRVESKKSGEGPYNCEVQGAGYKLSGSLVGSPNSHTPIPRHDWIELLGQEFYFGFSSISQMKSWFRNALNHEELASMFNVSIYTTDSFVVGKTQLCFDITKAKRIFYICMLEFFKLI